MNFHSLARKRRNFFTRHTFPWRETTSRGIAGLTGRLGGARTSVLQAESFRILHPRRQAIHVAWRHFIVFGFGTKPVPYGYWSRPGETARTHGQPISPGSRARGVAHGFSSISPQLTAKGMPWLSPLFFGDALDSYQTSRLRRYAPLPKGSRGVPHRHGITAPDSALGNYGDSTKFIRPCYLPSLPLPARDQERQLSALSP